MITYNMVYNDNDYTFIETLNVLIKEGWKVSLIQPQINRKSEYSGYTYNIMIEKEIKEIKENKKGKF